MPDRCGCEESQELAERTSTLEERLAATQELLDDAHLTDDAKLSRELAEHKESLTRCQARNTELVERAREAEGTLWRQVALKDRKHHWAFRKKFGQLREGAAKAICYLKSELRRAEECGEQTEWDRQTAWWLVDGQANHIASIERQLRATRGEHDECAIEDCPGQALPGDDCCLRHWAEETDPELFARREAEEPTNERLVREAESRADRDAELPVLVRAEPRPPRHAGEKLRRARKATGDTMGDAARRLGVSAADVSAVEVMRPGYDPVLAGIMAVTYAGDELKAEWEKDAQEGFAK